MTSVFTPFDGFISMKMSEVPLFKYNGIIDIVQKVGDGTFGLYHRAGKLTSDLYRTGMRQYIVKLFVMGIYFI